MKRRFWKMSGAGNDFVLLAGVPRARGAALARRLCDRRRGIGADGLLLLSRRAGKPRLDYWNSDGSAAFCGNGSRCGALWAASRDWARGRRFTLDTNVGPLAVRLTGKDRAEVTMPKPRRFRSFPSLKALSRNLSVHAVQVGVPHAVVFVPNIEKIDVKGLGRALRFHRAFGNAGANVDFAQFKGRTLHIRTYERGVEDETLACGTGIVAAAAVAHRLGKAGHRVRVKARGGDILNASFDGASARLEGPGAVTFTGEVSL